MRWQAGSETRYRLDVRESLRVFDDRGRPLQNAETLSTWYVTDTVRGRLANGLIEVDRRFDAADLLVRHPSLTGGADVEFRAHAPIDTLEAVPEPLRPAAALLGATLRFETDALGRVYNAVYTAPVPELAPPADSWRLFLDETLAVAPDAEVVIGDAWNASLETPLPTGPIQLDRRAKFQSMRRASGVRTAVIALLTEPVEPVDRDARPEPGSTVLTAYTQHGQVRFDLLQGQIRSSNLSTLTEFRSAQTADEVITQRLTRTVELRRLDPDEPLPPENEPAAELKPDAPSASDEPAPNR